MSNNIQLAENFTLNVGSWRSWLYLSLSLPLSFSLSLSPFLQTALCFSLNQVPRGTSSSSPFNHCCCCCYHEHQQKKPGPYRCTRYGSVDDHHIFPPHITPFERFLDWMDRRTYKLTDGYTDGRTDGQTDRPSHRDARMHPNMHPNIQICIQKRGWLHWTTESG